MEVISCHGASQDGPKKLSRFMREVTLARIMKISCELLDKIKMGLALKWNRESVKQFQW